MQFRTLGSLFVLTLAGCVAPSGELPFTDDDDSTDLGIPDVIPMADCDEAHPTATVGLSLCTGASEDGYLLLSSFNHPNTWLLDARGRVVHTWESPRLPGMSVLLRDDGVLVRALHVDSIAAMWPGVRGGAIEALAPDGEVLWEHTYGDGDVMRHHDIELMPNGDVLMVAYERVSRAEALALGRDPALLSSDSIWPDHVVQIDPSTGEEVWSWHVWDHLVQDRDPNLPNYGDITENAHRIDINAVLPDAPDGDGPDWNHMNTVSYDPVRDEVLMTALSQSEVWAVRRDGSGDLVWRWGNEQVWGGPGDGVLAGPHDAQVIPAGYPGDGHVLIFNNNGGSAGSSLVEVAPITDADGEYVRDASGWAGGDISWSFEDPGFHSLYASGAQRLAGGNTFITESMTGRMFEITPDGEVVWEFKSPAVTGQVLDQGVVPDPHSNAVFKATRIPPWHPGLAGLDLTPGEPLVAPPE